MKTPSSFSSALISNKEKVGPIEIPNIVAPVEEVVKPSFRESLDAIVTENFFYRKFKSFHDVGLTIGELEEAGGKEIEPLDDFHKEQVDPEYWPEISTAKTEGQFYRKLADIEERKKVNQIREEGGALNNLAADFLNGVTNPIYTYAPAVLPLKSVAAIPAFKHIFSKTIPAGILAAGVEEADLYFNHNARTVQEAISNTVVSGMIIGGMSGVASGVRSLKYQTYKSLLKEQLSGFDVKFRFNKKKELMGFTARGEVPEGAGGAAKVHNYDLINESIYGWGENGKPTVATPAIWIGAKVFRNPILRGLTSKSGKVRGYVNEMLEHNIDLTNGEWRPHALQTEIARRQSLSFNFQMDLIDGFYEHQGVDPNQNFLVKFAKSKFGKKNNTDTINDYSKKFYIAVVEGGVDAENPHIATRAKKAIEKYLNPIYEELVELEKLPANLTPKMAMQHVMRVYDREFIAANKNDTVSFVYNKFFDTNEKLISERKSSGFDDLEIEIKKARESIKSASTEEKNVLKGTLKELKAKREAITKRVMDKIAKGEYSDDMLMSGKNGKPTLRKVLNNDELLGSAKETIDTILSLTEEQMNGRINGLMKSGTSGTNPLKRRVLMIPDKDMIEFGMLNGDMRVSFNAYNLRMSRMVEMNKYLKSKGWVDPENAKLNEDYTDTKLSFLTKQIKDDYDILREKLEYKRQLAIKDKSGKELEKVENEFSKKALKLDEGMASDEETVSTIYNRLMGNTGVKYGKFLRSLNAVKQYYYSTELGAMFLLQMQDACTPIFRMGFKRYFNHGIKPYITNLATLNFEGNKRLREAALDLNIGIDSLTGFYNMNFAFDRPQFTPLSLVEKWSERAANTMGLLNFSSVWGDGAQHIASTATQSSIVRDLQSYFKGELSDRFTKRLFDLRILGDTRNAKTLKKDTIAKVILSQAEKHGEWENDGFLPNWHLWDVRTKVQKEAKNVFQNAIQKEVRSVLFSGSNPASFPVGGEPSGILGSFLMYMGWGFNAVSNITIPLVQRADSSRIMAASMMMSVASMVEPLRKFSKGEKLTKDDTDPSKIFKLALLNSGIMGTYVEMFNKFNAMGDIVPSARMDRFRNTRGMIQFGPERLIADAAQIAGMFVNREWNKKDWKKVTKNIPFANLIYLRRAINYGIDKLKIPETRHKASLLKEWK